MLTMSANTAEIAALGDRLKRAGQGAAPAYSMAINRVAATTRAGMVRVLAPQTGLKQKTLRKALKRKNSTAGTLSAEINSAGGDIALKFFGARETRAGVSAAPFSKRSVYSGTFMKGGKFPARVTTRKLGGHVWRRTGAGRGPIKIADSGVIIPEQMIEGASRATFYKTVEAELPKRLLHELSRRLAA